MPFILFGALAFFGVAVVACFGKLLNYARTEYRLFRRSARIRSALGFGNVSGSGISVRDIRSPDEAFDKVKQLVDSCRE